MPFHPGMRRLALDALISIGGSLPPGPMDADHVLHFTTDDLVVQLEASDAP